MPDDVPAVVEGQLMAQRHALARLIARIATLEGGAAWLDAVFPRDLSPQDGQEDPGAVPDRAFAILAARDEELALIGTEARNLLAHPPEEDD